MLMFVMTKIVRVKTIQKNLNPFFEKCFRRAEILLQNASLFWNLAETLVFSTSYWHHLIFIRGKSAVRMKEQNQPFHFESKAHISAR